MPFPGAWEQHYPYYRLLEDLPWAELASFFLLSLALLVLVFFGTRFLLILRGACFCVLVKIIEHPPGCCQRKDAYQKNCYMSFFHTGMSCCSVVNVPGFALLGFVDLCPVRRVRRFRRSFFCSVEEWVP